MNIIYLLTNISKKEGARYYIGSKTECSLIELNGIPTIVSLKNNKPYYSSSSNVEFQSDFKSGNIFVASVLEEVPDRSTLLSVENKHILKHDAVKSEEYYNLSEATVGGHSYSQDAPKNIFGETIKEYAKNESSSSKRRTRAKTLGFDNYGLLAFHIYNRSLSGENFSLISTNLGLERHFAQIYLKNWDMQKASLQLKSLDKDLYTNKLRSLITQGASLKKAAELLEIEEVVAEIFNNNFNTTDKNFSVAIQKGMSAEELELKVALDILKDNLGFKECAKKNGITILNAQRYFLRYVRKRLDTNDIK